MTRVLHAAALALALASGCDGDPPVPDAAIDAGIDAGGERDAGRDAGPMCMPECGFDETCCAEDDGSWACTQLRNDPRHCGLCQIDCIETHRGDGCSANQCTCGNSTLGCTGNRQSWCCPPRLPGTEPYCANLDRSPADCGACGAPCDPRRADRCDGGRCVCGDTRGMCAGTPDSICCAAGVDIACVDTTSDPVHCGGCNTICSAGERCEGGTCTRGEACAGGCEEAEICCNGGCCLRDRCIAGVCGGPAPDSGPDAGPDAGPDGGA